MVVVPSPVAFLAPAMVRVIGSIVASDFAGKPAGDCEHVSLEIRRETRCGRAMSAFLRAFRWPADYALAAAAFRPDGSEGGIVPAVLVASCFEHILPGLITVRDWAGGYLGPHPLFGPGFCSF